MLQAASRHVCSCTLGRQDACFPLSPRSGWQEASVLCGRFPSHCVRFGAQGPACSRGSRSNNRPASPLGLFLLRLCSCAKDDLSLGAKIAARTLSRRLFSRDSVSQLLEL